MPIFKNPIAGNLARWLTAATRPVQLMVRPDRLMDDIAAGADEIERLHTQAQRDAESIRSLIKYGESLEAQLVKKPVE